MPDDYATDAINGEETQPSGDMLDGTGVPRDFTFGSLGDEQGDGEPGESGTEAAGGDAEERQAVVDDDLVESLKQSLKAVAAERNRLKEEIARLTGRVQEPQPAYGQDEARPERYEYTHPDDSYRDAGKFVDPLLKGMPYDPVDNTVYVGDPADLKDGAGKPSKWVDPEDALKIARAAEAEKTQEQIAQKYLEAQVEQVLSAINERYESSLREMREKAIPGLPEEDAKLLDEFLKAYTSHRLGMDGYTVMHFVNLDEGALAKGAEYLRQSVEDIRKLFVSLSRSVNQSFKRAADTAPVESAHSAAVPQGKSPDEMTPAEHKRYLREQVRGLFES